MVDSFLVLVGVLVLACFVAGIVIAVVETLDPEVD